MKSFMRSWMWFDVQRAAAGMEEVYFEAVS